MDSVEIVKSSLQAFGWLGYAVFTVMLIGCLGIGIYFSLSTRNRVGQTSEALEYFLGGQSLGLFPITMSLIASAFTGIGFLGVSTEVYFYGSGMVFSAIGAILVGFPLHFWILPVLHALKLVSVFEYLDRRFKSRFLRLFASCLYLFSAFFRMLVIVYVAAITFNQMAGVDIYLISFITTLVCILYTCLGGLKAVVWTDVVQTFIIFLSLIAVAVKATVSVGGLGVVIERNLKSTRIEFPSLDPTIRLSFWACTIGGSVIYTAYIGLEQSMIQRYVALKTLREAKIAAWAFLVGYSAALIFAAFNGYLLYAVYHDCDPFSTGLVGREDQLLTLLVMQTMGQYPIMWGCFITGVFSASLSSISTALNSIVAVVYEDFIKLALGNRLSERQIRYTLRGTVLLIGLAAAGMTSIVDKLGVILKLTTSLISVTLGPLLGVFAIGMLMPYIGANPSLVGAFCGLVLTGWIVFQAQADAIAGTLSYAMKPSSVEGCSYTFNSTWKEPPVESEKEFYQLSFMYYALFGFFVTLIVANVCCLIFGKQDISNVDLELVAPTIRRLYSKKIQKEKLSDPIELVPIIENKKS